MVGICCVPHGLVAVEKAGLLNICGRRFKVPHLAMLPDSRTGMEQASIMPMLTDSWYLNGQMVVLVHSIDMQPDLLSKLLIMVTGPVVAILLTPILLLSG